MTKFKKSFHSGRYYSPSTGRWNGEEDLEIDDINIILKRLDPYKAYGPGEISVYLLKMFADTLDKLLCLLFKMLL